LVLVVADFDSHDGASCSARSGKATVLINKQYKETLKIKLRTICFNIPIIE
jgi:hypothetical protein